MNQNNNVRNNAKNSKGIWCSNPTILIIFKSNDYSKKPLPGFSGTNKSLNPV